MFEHHKESIEALSRRMQSNQEVLALIVAGSIAHGYASAESDVDVMIVVGEEEYRRREQSGELLYWDSSDCQYPGGYVDGKYVSVSRIKAIIDQGSEPERFAFTNTWLAFSRVEGLEELIREAACYPLMYQAVRTRRWYARFMEWCWYYNDALKKENVYLSSMAICNIVLFGGRAILAHNGLLFPFHKWFLRVLEGAPLKPDGLLATIDKTLESRQPEDVGKLIAVVKGFRDWGVTDNNWASFLMTNDDFGGHEPGL